MLPPVQPRPYDPELAYLDTGDEESSEEDDGIVGVPVLACSWCSVCLWLVGIQG